MDVNCLVQTNSSIDSNAPCIIVDIFIPGQQGSYKNLIIDYPELSQQDKMICTDFINTIVDNDGLNDSDCSAQLTNTPTFDGNNISVQIARSGEYTGFNPCTIDYSGLTVAYKAKIDSFMQMLQRLLNA